MWPTKEDIFGVPISRVSLTELARLLERRDEEQAVVVNVCNVHSVMSARTDRALAEAFENAQVNTPDGMPLVWVLRSRGHEKQERVGGVAICRHVIEYGLSRGWKHYFYGSTDATLDRLQRKLTSEYPSINIAGAFSPPFRDVSDDELETQLDQVKATKPDIVWVGLGMPKQERWMRRARAQLPGRVLIGVGAAFDFLSGTKPQAPAFLQQAGLEWAFRLACEPRRLWRRYAWNNPAFLALWLSDLAKRKVGNGHAESK
jgi:N-acetylglucosaminyldiphosphoundecaprenol N-acetyl-beta-D-mannosaminyltransferase